MNDLAEQPQYFDDVANPLDNVEEILFANEWSFDRLGEDELQVQVTGKMGEYRLFFVWQEEYCALQFCAQYDLDIHETALGEAARAMTAINSGLWLGHFDLREGTSIPCFRHTSLFRGMTSGSGIEQIEDLVDIAMHECERFYPAFHLLSRARAANENGEERAALDLAMMPSAGRS